MDANNVEQTHTQGRLTINQNGIAVGGPFHEYTNGSAQSQVFMVCVMETASHVENARRLAACWNACEGLPTDRLESESIENTLACNTGEIYELRAKLAIAFVLLAEMLQDAEEIYADNWAQSLESHAAVKVRAFLNGGAK
jgi:hypothetical protein